MTKEKKSILITVIVVTIIVGGTLIYSHKPPLFQGDTPTSTPEVIEPIIEEPALPITQVEDEYFEIDKHYNDNGLLYCQTLYTEDLKLKKDKLSEYLENIKITQLENTELKEAEVLTLYVRGKGLGTATLKIGDAEVIILELENGKWLTKWGSASGWWTQGQINNAYVEYTGNIKVSSTRLYAEDQHSLTDNFDSYSTGNLPGQGSWTGSNNIDVTDAVTQSGTRSVTSVAAGTATKTFTEEVTGNQIAYMRGAQTNISIGKWGIRDGGSIIGSIHMRNDATLSIYSGAYYSCGTYVADTWYKTEIEWDQSRDSGNGEFRCRIDDGSWNTWRAFRTAGASADEVYIDDAGNGGTFYLDSFSDPNAGAPAGAERYIRNPLIYN